MVIFVILKWYKFLYYKEILSIYWMALVQPFYDKHDVSLVYYSKTCL